MDRQRVYRALNRLLTISGRSLVTYISYASPWIQRGEEEALATVKRIAADQQESSNRIAKYTLRAYGPVEMGEFPIAFLDLHDLALAYLIHKLVGCQRRDVVALERCLPDLHGDPTALALAEDALGAARGHLETLEELTGQLDRTSSTK